jgi:hypothetical protein
MIPVGMGTITLLFMLERHRSDPRHNRHEGVAAGSPGPTDQSQGTSRAGETSGQDPPFRHDDQHGARS